MGTKRITLITKSNPVTVAVVHKYPIMSFEADGARQVLKITGYQDAIPAGFYVGAGGLVATAAAATDLKGATGLGKSVLISGATTLTNYYKYVAAATGNTASLPTIAPADGFECQIESLVAAAVTLAIPGGYTLKVASSRSVGTAIEDISYDTVASASYVLPKGVANIRVFVNTIYIN